MAWGVFCFAYQSCLLQMDSHRAQYVPLMDNEFNKECTLYTTEPAQAINNSNGMLITNVITGKLMIPGQLKLYYLQHYVLFTFSLDCALQNICSGTDYKK